MVPMADKPGPTFNPAQEKKKEKKRFPAAFAKYKFYLDIKASKVKSTLIEDILALGGSLVEFLTKEVTHVISEGPEWKFLLVSNGTSCGPPSPWTPGGTPSPSASWDGDRNKKIKSRAESILNATKAPERSGGCSDVLEIAKKFKCHIWSLNKTLTWLTKFKSKYGNLHSGQKQNQQKHKERELRDPFLKLDSCLRYAKPTFSEFKSWPRISLEGWAGSSPFSEQRKKQKKKSFPGRFELNHKKEEPSPRRKECAKKKDGGFCEICNKSYSDLDGHLKGELHNKFVKDVNNWTEVDCKVDTSLPLARSILF
jgi:hypothetical protein